jgi:hypothetical protein
MPKLELPKLQSNLGSVLKGRDMYVVRVMKDGKYGYSKPCAHCIEEMRRHGIYRVFYTLDSPEKELWYACEKLSLIAGTPSSGNRKIKK